jgi:hypothetical protein
MSGFLRKVKCEIHGSELYAIGAKRGATACGDNGLRRAGNILK